MEDNCKKLSEVNINKILIHRLRHYKSQNFSQLLNTPEPEQSYFSYFGGLVNLFYNTVYDEESTLDSEIDQDFEKFSDDCIIITEAEMNNYLKNKKEKLIENEEQTENKNPFKNLLNEPLDNYIKKINLHFGKYKENHTFHKYKSISSKNYNNEKLIDLSSIYKRNKDFLTTIPDEYKIPDDKFKTDTTLLSQPMNVIRKKCSGLILISGKIDSELKKMLCHTTKLDTYIQTNLKPFDTGINLYYNEIKKIKELVTNMKYKNIGNSSLLIMKQIRLKNTKKIRKILVQFRKLKDSINLLKVLITDVKKYKLTTELINKSKTSIEKLKKISDGKIKIIELFEICFENYKTKNSTHMSGEMTQILNKFFDDFITIDEDITNNHEFFQISQKTFDEFISYSPSIKNLLTHLNFKELREEIEQINNVCIYYIQNNLISNIYTKLRGIFTNISNDYINKILELLKFNINNDNKTNKNDKNNSYNILKDRCLLLCLSISKIKFGNCVKTFVNTILNNVQNSDNENINKIIKNNFNNECKEINDLIDENLNTIIKNQIIKCLGDTLNSVNIDLFAKDFHKLSEILNELITQEEKSKNILFDCQNTFIKNWQKETLDKFATKIYQTWEPVQGVPLNCQQLLDFYFNFDLKENAVGSDIQNYITKYENFKKIENDIGKNTSINHSENKNQFISIKYKTNNKNDNTINEIKTKISGTSVDIIKTSFNIIKLYCLLSPNIYGNLLEIFTEIITKHLNYQKDEIFSYKNSNITVTQREVCMTYCIFILIKYIYLHFKDCDFFVNIIKYSEQKYINSFLAVNKIINECLETSKKKIEELLNNDCIEESLKQLNNIQLPNYNIPGPDSELPVNNYVYTFISVMKIIYDSMAGCYEKDFMEKLFQSKINNFFDKFEFFIFHGRKIEDEKCLKQFRKDMTFLKKNLSFIDIFDISEIKLRIDKINKKVLPESMLKFKKKNE